MSSTYASPNTVTVIIPNWNGASFLRACIDSVLRQNGILKDVVVVDNGSTDSSSDVLASYGSAIRVVQLNTNLGFACAVNAGIKASRTDLLFVLNNDAVLEDDCLLNLTKATKSYSTYGFYAAEIRHFDERTSLWSAGIIFSERGHGNRSGRHLLAKTKTPVEIFGVCGAAALFKRSILDEVGMFNEDFFLYHEDIELSFRHQLRGYRCLYVPGAIVYHHGSATTKKIFRRTVEHRIRNSIITVLTCMPGPLLARYAGKIFRFYAQLSRCVIKRGYLWCWIRALSYVALHSFGLLVRRRELQRLPAVDHERIDALLYRGPVEVNFPNEVVYL